MNRLHFIISASIIMISCAPKYDKRITVVNNSINSINDTLREKYAVVNDFLETKIKDRSKKIMIHSKKINTNMTLKICILKELLNSKE